MQTTVSLEREPGTDDMASQTWPEEGKERVQFCPVCGSTTRSLLHRDLTDRVFFCAPGKWQQYLCAGCGCAYLDPRPTVQAIHLAYRTYYTHHFVADGGRRASSSVAYGLGRLLSNGYRNWRFGTHFSPSWALGVPLLALLRNKRRAIDRSLRHLPRLPPGAHVLDLGFGSGDFLLRVKGGWSVSGADPDPAVVAMARANGLIDVREGGLEAFAEREEYYDAITLSHVIEHVHEPRAVLRMAYRLLKRGGVLWIDTPNLNGPGHKRFGRHWRGLEPPRHLVLFHRQALIDCTAATGFSTFEDLPYSAQIGYRFRASLAVERGVTFVDNQDALSAEDQAEVTKAEARAKVDLTARDSISFICRRPS